jgi:hypothetical protein
MSPTVLLLASLLSFGESETSRGATLPIELGAELSTVSTLGSRPIFDYATCVGSFALIRIRERWGAGVVATYRQVLDADPASSFWYAEVGARGRVRFARALALRLDLGWSFRHIGLDGGYSNTVGGPMAGGGLGLTVYTRGKLELVLAAVYHITGRLPSEPFVTQDIGLALSSGWTMHFAPAAAARTNAP